MPDYTDRSYAPIGPALRYERGDGAIVTLTIEAPPGGLHSPVVSLPTAAPAVAPPAQAPAIIDLFGDAARPASPTSPASPAKPKTNGDGKVHRQFTAKLPKGVAKLVKHAQMEGRKHGHKPAAVAPVSRTPGPLAVDPGVYDHPDVGGKYTIFVLLYGAEQYFDLHQRCLNSIAGTVPEGRCDLRVGSNELNSKSVKLIESLQARGLITKHYQHKTNDRKYPVMREMFYDPALPITTKWVVWFDDDSIADRTPNWLGILSQMIIQHHRPENVHMLGAKFVWSMKPGQADWIRSRPWYQQHQRPFRLSNGKGAPNGDRILFATGGFWALTHEALVACDIPDAELGHNGGDYMIGEQLYQGGFGLKNFNNNKQFIHTSSVKRRGLSETHPGTRSPANG